MTRHSFRKKGGVLVPTSQEADEALGAIKDGTELLISLSAPRNIKSFRLFWALVGILAENGGVSKDEAKKNLCFATGYVDHWYEMKTGRLHVEPRSIAWENMSPDEFARFLDAAIAKTCEWLGNSPDEIREELYRLVDGPRG